MRNEIYKHYMLGILVLSGVVGVFERFVFSLSLESIKQDLQLSDSQLGLLTGIAFTVFYAVAGVPIARWADKGNRVSIIAGSASLLGLMVSLCGIVSNFYQLLLVRAGVAVGEAGITPASQSLISDYFSRAERPQAIAIYFSCYSISMVVGYVLGGWLVETYGWRITFVVLGLPGLLIAMLVRTTLREPRVDIQTTTSPPVVALRNTLNTLWYQRTFRQILFAFCISYFFTMGVSQWLATFFIRSHNMTAMEVGSWLGFSFGVFATLGNYLGAIYVNRYAQCQEARQMRALAYAMIAHGIFSTLGYLSPNKHIAFIFIGIGAAFLTFGNGPVFAAVQSLVNERTRSAAVAILFLFANLIGFGFGPLALGVLSDLLNPLVKQHSLRYALVIFAPGVFWISFHYWKASQSIESDIDAVERRL